MQTVNTQHRINLKNAHPKHVNPSSRSTWRKDRRKENIGCWKGRRLEEECKGVGIVTKKKMGFWIIPPFIVNIDLSKK